ncbi:ring-cleaving dioxygenase [Tuberibacillus sp. Marseille-P3662]|uniref:ring-cleaving dioxygenase n=1 Tax=Tuberibacillus sp. Marseille-P3662 TaxID=1965358 RepID=UPI000A1CB031|nr:ring-cleaving dioxygenase [Tuberibacillus sp. Marseille-P3662]
MSKTTKGIHHITAIAGDPQENIDFYAGVLGLRLVKKTVNFDDPGTYHLYFGNELGHPGTIMTFFPWAGVRQGRSGAGQVSVTSFVVPEQALPFWEKRLMAFDVSFQKVTRFDETYLQFTDPHGLQLELVARKAGENSQWLVADITPDVAIKGFGGAVLSSGSFDGTAEVLTDVLGLKQVSQDDQYLRFYAEGERGQVIDLKISPQAQGLMGAGTVHHIAWRAQDDEDQLEWRSHLSKNQLQPTDVKDRQYFNSVYFREHGGILFEIATDTPGFDTDESYENLGQALKLPQWLEQHRGKIEEILSPVDVQPMKGDRS